MKLREYFFVCKENNLFPSVLVFDARSHMLSIEGHKALRFNKSIKKNVCSEDEQRSFWNWNEVGE